MAVITLFFAVFALTLVCLSTCTYVPVDRWCDEIPRCVVPYSNATVYMFERHNTITTLMQMTRFTDSQLNVTLAVSLECFTIETHDDAITCDILLGLRQGQCISIDNGDVITDCCWIEQSTSDLITTTNPTTNRETTTTNPRTHRETTTATTTTPTTTHDTTTNPTTNRETTTTNPTTHRETTTTTTTTPTTTHDTAAITTITTKTMTETSTATGVSVINTATTSASIEDFKATVIALGAVVVVVLTVLILILKKCVQLRKVIARLRADRSIQFDTFYNTTTETTITDTISEPSLLIESTLTPTVTSVSEPTLSPPRTSTPRKPLLRSSSTPCF